FLQQSNFLKKPPLPN
ncbi:Protein FdhE, partial [Haemophilus influenzae]